MSLLLLFGSAGTNGVLGIINSFGEQSQVGIINSFGEQSRNAISAALGLESRQPVRLDLSPGVQQIQKLLLKLCEGDPFLSVQSLKNKLVNEKQKTQRLLNILSGSTEGVQKLLLKLCEGDPFLSVQSLKNKLVNEKQKTQRLLNILSGSTEGVQAVLHTLSSGDVSSLQKVLVEIAEKDSILGQQNLLQSLQDMTSTVPNICYDIFLDGVSIKSKIKEVTVCCDEGSVHNSVNIRSVHSGLFWDCDPTEKEGTSRIKVSVGNRQIYFLVEKRSGDEKSFSLWGRSLSAREESPYCIDLDYSLDEPKSAKSVVEEILSVSSLNWQCDDWVLPVSFEFKGPPMEGLSQIASVVGAVIRCEDNGTVCVRQRFPVRPVYMNGESVAVNYGRKNLIKLDYNHTKGTHYNAVEVVGCTDDVYLPDIYVEESSPEMGDDVHIRVYWAGKKPSGIIETYVTDGKITLLGEETKEEDEDETITFKDGVASVSKPITSVKVVEWVGDSGGQVTYDKYSKDLEIVNEVYCIAKVTYTATYSRYRISDHNVEVLLALLTFGGESDVSVEVKMGDGDRPAPELSRPLLTCSSIAVVAGTAWLDNNKYNQKRVTLETTYNDDAIDGVLVYVNDAEIDCIGNFHVESSTIVINGPKVVNTLGIVQCQI